MKQIYRDWVDSREEPVYWPPLHEELSPHLDLFKGRVLNAGAGHRPLQPYVEGEVTNQDIESGLHNANIHIYSPLHRIPKPDGFFDCVICNAVLEHVDNPFEIVMEFNRVTRKGGILYLAVPFLQPEHRDPTDFQRYTRDGLALLVERAGYEVTKTETLHSPYHTIGWILKVWLNSDDSFVRRVIRRLVFFWLRVATRRSKSRIDGVASCYRVIARKVTASKMSCVADANYEPVTFTDLPKPPSEFSTSQMAFGMTTSQEQGFFAWYTQNVFTGVGEIVDLGCWLGSTTVALAKGLRANGHSASQQRKVHAYDRFIWEEWMSPWRNQSPVPLPEASGDSFLPAFRQLIAEENDLIVVHDGDLAKKQWEGDAIEFLLVDAMKNWELSNHILKEFFVHLIPGRSVVLHQDFVHYYTGWIHLIMYRLKEYFSPYCVVRGSSSVAFQLIKPLPLRLLSKGFRPDEFNLAEVSAAFSYSRGLLPEESHAAVYAAEAMYYVHIGDLARASSYLKNLDPNCSTANHDIICARQALETAMQKHKNSQ